MLCRDFVAGVLLAGTLSACAAVDLTVAPRYDTVSRSIAQARNESILLNIVRASHDYPLSFSTISQVIPQMTNTTTVGMPSFLEGPNPQCLNVNAGAIGAAGAARCLTPPGTPGRDIIFGNTNNLTDAIAVQTQFNLSTQETKDFYNALLRPVDLYILNFFIRQGYSRELLFWLFMDLVEVTIGTAARWDSSSTRPYDYGCPQQDPRKRCFREWTELATVTGLSVDQHTEKGENGKIASFSRFCFDDVLGRRGSSRDGPGEPGTAAIHHGQIRGSRHPAGAFTQMRLTMAEGDRYEAATDTLKFHVGPLQFEILPRSAYAIYQFLGKLLRQQNGGLEFDESQIPEYIRKEDIRPELSTVREDKQLLNVVLNQSTSACFAETRFIDGYYCVPEEGSANTKRIFSLLAQLLALQTSASDLAITPTVHTVQ